MENNHLPNEFRPTGEWFIFGMGYLQISLMACEEMIRGAVDRKIKNGYLYIPTIYNVKHAMEIFEKLIILVIHDESSLKGEDCGHDIKKLFKKLESSIDLKGMAIFFANNPSDYYLTNIAEIKKRIAESSILIDKYYHLSFLIEKIGTDFIIEDNSNTAFRYPQNDLLIKPKYQKILDKLTINDVEQIKNDVLSLTRLWEIGLSIGIYLMKKNENRSN